MFHRDILILNKYNECSQEYKKLNVIHDNITIYHCIIGHENTYEGTDIDISYLYPVSMKEESQVFKRICNFDELVSNRLCHLAISCSNIVP